MQPNKSCQCCQCRKKTHSRNTGTPANKPAREPVYPRVPAANWTLDSGFSEAD